MVTVRKTSSGLCCYVHVHNMGNSASLSCPVGNITFVVWHLNDGAGMDMPEEAHWANMGMLERPKTVTAQGQSDRQQSR